ncbi:MAG TPA: hypothetical protein VM537_29490 [Anaerolineae bacterium]|nr:hypothetical protein [Anaerolineae bacterium]
MTDQILKPCMRLTIQFAEFVCAMSPTNDRRSCQHLQKGQRGYDGYLTSQYQGKRIETVHCHRLSWLKVLKKGTRSQYQHSSYCAYQSYNNYEPGYSHPEHQAHLAR